MKKNVIRIKIEKFNEKFDEIVKKWFLLIRSIGQI